MKINRLLKIAIPFVIAVLILLFTISFLGEEQSVKSVRNDNNESETVQFPDFPIDNNEDTLEMEEEETVIDELKPYDTITFGEWHGELINWRVLEVRDQKVLVISERILALRQYEEIIDGFSLPTWAKCSLRSWLNNDFYQAAFSEEEQSAIILTSVNTPDFETEFETNHTDGFVEKTPVIVKGFDDTEDMVFCLSVEEAYKYFYSSEDRIAYLNVTQQDYDYAVQALIVVKCPRTYSVDNPFGRADINRKRNGEKICISNISC